MTKKSVRTPAEKLRGLVNLKIKSQGFFTQKELSETLGISERTLRRFKNQAGYQLSPKTLARSHAAIVREDKKIKRLLDAGAVVLSRRTTVRGKRRQRYVLAKDKSLKAPLSKVMALPVVYPAKAGGSRTILISVEGWETQEKIDYLISAHESGRFSSWHAKVDLRKYLIQKLIEEYGDLDSVPADVMAETLAPHYIMIGPFELGRVNANVANVRNRCQYYDDAGRKIVEISVVEKIKPTKKQKPKQTKKRKGKK